MLIAVRVLVDPVIRRTSRRSLRSRIRSSSTRTRRELRAAGVRADRASSDYATRYWNWPSTSANSVTPSVPRGGRPDSASSRNSCWSGWLPDREARYISVDPGDVSGEHKLTLQMCRLMASGRSRSTTPPASSSRTIETPTASTTSPRHPTPTAQSRRRFWRLWRRPPELPSNHGRLEQHRPAVPPRAEISMALGIPLHRTGLTTPCPEPAARS